NRSIGFASHSILTSCGETTHPDSRHSSPHDSEVVPVELRIQVTVYNTTTNGGHLTILAQHEGVHGAHVDGDARLDIGCSRPESVSTTPDGELCIAMNIDQLDELRDFGCL